MADQDAESVAEWAERMRKFLDTWNYDLITQEDVDRLHDHLSLTLRLRAIPETWFIQKGVDRTEQFDGKEGG